MGIKGVYNSGTSYSVGDVVQLDGVWYTLKKSASAGTSPLNDEYWNPKDPTLDDVLDLLGDLYTQQKDLNPNAQNIVLASSTDASTKKFKIKVVDNGTISATEIT